MNILCIIPILFFLSMISTSSITPAFAQVVWSEQVSSTPNNLNDIFFIDANKGWAAGDGGTIIYTDNGGMGWIDLGTGIISENINSIFFPTPNNGLAVADNGIILYTEDGGDNWITIPTTFQNNLNDVFFIDQNIGWAAGDGGVILYTENGGVEWIVLATVSERNINSIFFTNANNGFLVDSNGQVAVTTDGGTTWIVTHRISNVDEVNDIFFIDENNGWVVGKAGIVAYTTDGGKIWWAAMINSTNPLNSIYFIDKNNGWAVGDSGVMFTSTDGGKNWDKLSSFTSENLNSIYFTAANNGLVVGNNGVLFTMFADEEKDELPPKKSNGGCADCTPPTLGLDKNFKRVVDDGFVYNGISTQVEKWHTPYPLINATVGEMNLVEIIIFENNGINNMKLVQFGLGAEGIGVPLNDLEVLIEVHLITNGTNTGINVDEIVINDKDNLIDNDTVSAVSYAVQCQDDDTTQNCVKVDLNYSYRESTINHIMVINVMDKPRNSQNFYFNDGVQVLGDSMNPTPYYIMQNKHTSQQTEDLYKTLIRTDKVNHIWIDENGIEYLKISDNRFDRITPHESYQCTDPPLAEVNVPTRNNCHFRALTSIWDY